jgi:hypothetical protein
MTARRLISCTVAALTLAPAAALAQAAIAGIVRDGAGQALAGARVEAGSPELIEKVRPTRTDASGQYRIVDLRPGVYAVTFSADGFATSRHEGIVLTGAFTATVDADLRPGTAGEVVSILDATPLVDVQSVQRQTTIGSELIAALPTARSYGGLMQLVPSIVASTADGQVTPRMLGFSGPGGRGSGEGRLEVDGLSAGLVGGNGVSPYVADLQNAREVAFTTSPAIGEAEVSAPVVSIVPRSGSNALTGSFFLGGVPGALVGSNYSRELKDAGLTTPDSLLKVWDVTAAVGGPIRKDRLWFFLSVRNQGSYRTVPGMHANLNAGDPSKWTYAADLSRPAQTAGSWTIVNLRLTAQPSPRHKISLFWDEQMACAGASWAPGIEACREQPESGAIIAGGSQSAGIVLPATSTTAPETVPYFDGSRPQRVQQATWQSPLTDRWLAEAGFGTYLLRAGGELMPGSPTADLIRMSEQCGRGCPDNGGIASLVYRSANWADNWGGRYTWRASATHATGVQTLKFGYQGGFLESDSTAFTNSHNLAFRVNNGVPNQLTQNLNPFLAAERTRFDGFYGQFQRTLSRFTLQGAIRFDRAWSWFPATQIGPTRFLPTPITLPETIGVDAYTDLSPRAGIVYDVFGNARTSVKVNLGRYLQNASTGGNYGATSPVSRMTTTVNRSWTDANRNFVPDCDLMNPDEQDLRQAGGDFCARISDLKFGTTSFSDSYDPRILSGWGVRPSDWTFGMSVQQQLRGRMSIEAGYFRRWLNGFTVTDNLARAPSDYGTFSIVAPRDPRLPGGGGYTIGDLYDPNQNVASSVENYNTSADSYGYRYQHYNGFLIDFTMRLTSGLALQGGVNTGKTVSDSCDARALLPETAPLNPYCHVDSGLVTRVTALGTYTIPRLDVQVAGTFRSDPGVALVANYTVSNAEVARSLGRNLSNDAANVAVNLIPPGSAYGDRVNELSLRFAKILRFGGTRLNVGIDVNNVFNSAAVLAYNPAFIPGAPGPWLTPTSIVQPRYARLTAQVDF